MKPLKSMDPTLQVGEAEGADGADGAVVCGAGTGVVCVCAAAISAKQNKTLATITKRNFGLTSIRVASS